MILNDWRVLLEFVCIINCNSMENILAVLVKGVRGIRLFRAEFWIKLRKKSKLDSCQIIFQNKISNAINFSLLIFQHLRQEINQDLQDITATFYPIPTFP